MTVMRKTIFCLSVAFLASACGRREPGLTCPEEEKARFAIAMSTHIGDATRFDAYVSPEDVHRCVETGFLKARGRRLNGDGETIIPLYCQFSPANAVDRPRGGFELKMWGFGPREGWEAMSRIWFLLVMPASEDGLCEEFACSLKEISRECKVSRRRGTSVRAEYLCGDLLFGIGDAEGAWIEKVSTGKARLYILLATGNYGPEGRMRRSVLDAQERKSLRHFLMASGRLLELIPVARVGDGCIVECR